ncbi:unnamed protein product [Acanthoscelides obtectus]|uniref:DDE Tnp4 domain-containing protein n=1 Tax=Acanthoscelides obtectus TaxID=200917 RepID=A0A9P0KHP3_ACAOB|nr:unnamed protein product [Acanthoscelides obtectus]CAK1654680.1 hypothetical protein AOBTE_LOCUS18764 [Acanthoscelides obtectus]
MLYYLAMTVMVLSHAFRNPIPEAEINYNKLLKQERVIIERCFGQLKRRFPILQYVCGLKLENVPKIIIACIVLHHVAKRLGHSDFELVEQDPDEDEGNHENDELPLCQLGCATTMVGNVEGQLHATIKGYNNPSLQKGLKVDIGRVLGEPLHQLPQPYQSGKDVAFFHQKRTEKLPMRVENV